MKYLLFLLLLISYLTTSAQTNPFIGLDRRNPFAAVPAGNEQVTFQNPVIPGFYSDPSVCRVGDDYYLVTSTFEYFPGVPVFHSKDLVNWEKIGHCISRKEQIPNGMNIFAPTIRYKDGTFYMITTNIIGGGNFYITATNPAGPWSDPVWIKVPGIDPSLFFDEDGKTYVICSEYKLYEINIKTGELLSEGRKVWNGTGGRYPEGPHIYKKDGFYYLMAAEGGTEEAHSETIARSYSVWGPYTDFQANPILTHCNAAGQGNPIQGLGHADLVQAHDDSWWMVFHGYRTVGGGIHHILGRETCLAPVDWPKNGWPVVNGNGTITPEMYCPTLPLKPFPAKPTRINFDDKKLGLDWNYVQFPQFENYSLSDRSGYLRLRGSAENINTQTTSTFTGRRLENLFFTTTTRIEFDPENENEEAGIILLNNGSHFDILIKNKDGKRVLFVKLQFGRTIYKSKEILLQPGSVDLRIKGEKSIFIFSYSQNNEKYTDAETVDSKFLSSETADFCTGVYVGLYATGNGKASKAFADYDWFEYTRK